MASPQDMKLPQLQKEGTQRLGGLQAPKLDSGFIDVIDREIEASNAGVRKRNALQVDIVKTKFKNQVERELLIPEQARVAQTKGLDTIDAQKKSRETILKGIDKIKNKYGSEFHGFLEEDIEEIQTRFVKNTEPHVFKETNGAVAEEYKVATANAMNETVIENSSNPEDLENSLMNIGKQVAKQSSLEGYSYDHPVTQARTAEAYSKTLLQAVTYQASLGRLDIGEGILKKFESDFNRTDYPKAVEALNRIRENMGSNEASSWADKAFQQFPNDPAARYEYLNTSIKNDRIKKQAIAFENLKQKSFEKQREANLISNKAKIFNSIQKTGKVDQAAWLALDPEERQKISEMLSANRGGLPEVTVWQERDKVLGMILDLREPMTMEKLHAHRDVIGGKDMVELEKMLTRRLSADTAELREAQKGRDLEEVRNIAKQLANSNKLSHSPKARSDFEMLVAQRYDQILAENPKFTRRQILVELQKDVAARGFKKEKVPGGWWWSDDVEKNVPNPDLVKPEPAKVIHPSYKEALKKKFPKATDAQINEFLDIKIKSGKDLSKPYIAK